MNQSVKIYREFLGKIDLPFLFFLLTISSNKIYLKVIALVLIFVLKPKIEWRLVKEMPLFYPGMAAIAILQFLIFNNDYSVIHFMVLFTGVGYWIISFLYMYQAVSFVKQNEVKRMDYTLYSFVLINLTVCIINYISISVHAGTLFPFWSQNELYGASSGDYLTGLFNRPSYINAIISSLFALYFLDQKKRGWFVICLLTALISFANIFNLIFVFILLLFGFWAENAKQRITAFAGVILCFLMYVIVSPDNYNYIKKTIGLSVNDEQEIMPQVVMDSDGKAKQLPVSVKYRNDSSAGRQKIRMIDRNLLFKKDFSAFRTYDTVDITRDPGKKIALLQTFRMLADKPINLIAGAGVGNFSSRLAFQYSGRDSSRLFLKLPKYTSGLYYKNHLLIYDSMRQLPNEYHSIKHFPNNFLSQLLGEYGLAGVCAFLLFYVLYFFKRFNSKRFVTLFFLCILSYLMLDYLFEFFNVMLIFEVLLLASIRKQNEANGQLV